MSTWLSIYNVIAAFSVALQVFFLVNAIRRRDQYARIFGTTLTCSILLLVANILSLNAVDIWMARICAAICSSMLLCTELGISLFIVRYTESEKYMMNVIRISAAIVAVFIGLYIANVFFGFFYTLEQKSLQDVNYWHAKDGSLIWIHNVAVGLLEAQIAIQLTVRAIISPRIYKYRYVVPTVVFTLIWMINGLAHLTHDPADVSILIFSFFSGFISLFVTYRVPVKLTERMIRMANFSMKDGLLCYDNMGNPVFSNTTAKALFATEREPKEAMRTYRINRVEKPLTRESYEEKWEEAFVLDGQENIFDVRYKHICEKNQIVGSYLQFTDKTEELLMFEQQRYQATHDSLTGIYNRERFFKETQKRISEFPNIPWMMLVSNIRDFRLVNELFGEETGDAILIREAEDFRKYAHRSSLYGRIMDDKFALFMDKRYFSPDMLMGFINDMRSITEQRNYRLHVQVGIYELTDPRENVVLIYDKAVLALPTIESEYQKVFAYYDSNQMEQRLREHQIVEDFDAAMKNGEFQLFLQAQFNCESKTIGADAIPCLASKQKGVLFGKDLQSAIEHSGVVHILDEYIWENATKLLSEWKTTHPDWYISIHVSAKDIYYIDVIETLKTLIEKYDVSAKCLHVEIDESTLMLNPKSNVGLIHELQELGFFVVISEFGNGYSSLNMLKDMRPDAIRLDHMVDPEDGDEERGLIVIKAILSMAKKLKIQTIVCDIQTEEEHQFILSNGADVYQGSFYAFPAAVDEFFQMTEWKPE